MKANEIIQSGDLFFEKLHLSGPHESDEKMSYMNLSVFVKHGYSQC